MAKTEITLTSFQVEAIHDVLIKARQTVNAINPNLGSKLLDVAKFLEHPDRFGTEVTDEDQDPENEEPVKDHEDGFTEPPYGAPDEGPEPVAETTDAEGGENVPTPDGPEEPAEPEAS